MTATMTMDIPRMTTDADVDCVRAAVSGVPAGGVAVEFGPWLGGLSVVLADRLDLHVVDRFLWTSDHMKKVPGKLNVDDDFQSMLHGTLIDAGLRATIHKSTFENFTWDGGKIAMIVVDGPKTAPTLKACLSGVINHLDTSATVLIKNGLSPLYSDMATYLERLVDAEILRLPEQTVLANCNMPVSYTHLTLPTILLV